MSDFLKELDGIIDAQRGQAEEARKQAAEHQESREAFIRDFLHCWEDIIRPAMETVRAHLVGRGERCEIAGPGESILTGPRYEHQVGLQMHGRWKFGILEFNPNPDRETVDIGYFLLNDQKEPQSVKLAELTSERVEAEIQKFARDIYDIYKDPGQASSP